MIINVDTILGTNACEQNEMNVGTYNRNLIIFCLGSLSSSKFVIGVVSWSQAEAFGVSVV